MKRIAAHPQRRIVQASVVALLPFIHLVVASAKLDARPQYHRAAQAKYPRVGEFSTDKCFMCHFGSDKKNRNEYGLAFERALGAKNVNAAAAIDAALERAEMEKSPLGGTFGERLRASQSPVQVGAAPSASAAKSDPLIVITSKSSTRNSQGRRMALLVGVDQFDHSAFKALKSAQRDMEAMAAVLSNSDFDVRLLTSTGKGNAKATLAHIHGSLASLLVDVTKSDILLIALAGQGWQVKIPGPANRTQLASYFVPADAEPGVPGTMLSIGDLLKLLESRGAGTNLVLIDACHEETSSEHTLDGAAVDSVPKGVAMLFSCASGQHGVEVQIDGAARGVFFESVVRGFKSEARDAVSGKLDWDGLATYVRSTVPSEVKRASPAEVEQTPVLLANLPSLSSVVLHAGATNPSSDVPSAAAIPPPAAATAPQSAPPSKATDSAKTATGSYELVPLPKSPLIEQAVKDGDQIALTLAKAKSDYEHEYSEFLDAAKKYFEQRKSSAFSPRLDIRKAEQMFLAIGVFPNAVTSSLRERGLRAQAVLRVAYLAAHADYEASGKRALATVVESELEEFWSETLPRSFRRELLLNPGCETAISAFGSGGKHWSAGSVDVPPYEGKRYFQVTTGPRGRELGEGIDPKTKQPLAQLVYSDGDSLSQGIDIAPLGLRSQILEFKGCGRCQKGSGKIEVKIDGSWPGNNRKVVAAWEFKEDIWTPVSGKFTLPKEADRVIVILSVPEQSTAYFDGLSLRAVTK